MSSAPDTAFKLMSVSNIYIIYAALSDLVGTDFNVKGHSRTVRSDTGVKQGQRIEAHGFIHFIDRGSLEAPRIDHKVLKSLGRLTLLHQNYS